MFQLHPRLEADTLEVEQLPLCDLRLMNDRRFPWFILVPRQPQITEVHQLSQRDQQRLMQESSQVAQAIASISNCHKINLGALGNLVPQLHWHIIGRSEDDACWPGPVWGCGTVEPYAEEDMARLIEQMQQVLKGGITGD